MCADCIVLYFIACVFFYPAVYRASHVVIITRSILPRCSWFPTVALFLFQLHAADLRTRSARSHSFIGNGSASCIAHVPCGVTSAAWPCIILQSSASDDFMFRKGVFCSPLAAEGPELVTSPLIHYTNHGLGSSLNYGGSQS